MSSATGKSMAIAVTGLNANDNPGPGVAVARALKEAFGTSIKIIGLAYEALEPGIYMKDIIDCTYQVPYAADGSAALLKRLLEINEQERLNLIIPNFDAELLNFIKIGPELRLAGIETFLPDAENLAQRDKLNLNNFGALNSFDVPPSRQVRDINDLWAAAEALNYPLVIKGRFYEADIVYTFDAAQKAFYRLSSKWGLPVIAQEFINGNEINVAGLGDGKGNLISAIPMRKLYITDKGKAWAGVTIEDADLVVLAERFATATKWKGGFELEIIKSKESRFYIIEINPRFPAWVYLTAVAGQNQPAALVKMSMGEYVAPLTEYAAGKMFVRYSWDGIVDIADFQQFSAFGKI